MKDLPMTYIDGNNWPKNDNRQYQYARTVYQGIVSSVNTVSARTLDTIGAGLTATASPSITLDKPP